MEDVIGQHPDLEEVAAFADGALSGEERQRVVEHLAGCASCYAVLSGVVAFQEEEAAAGGAVAAMPRRPAGSAGGRWVAVAAALLLALGAAWVGWSLLRPGDPGSTELVAGLAAPPEALAAHLWPGPPVTRSVTKIDVEADRRAFRIGTDQVDLRVALAAGDVEAARERLRRLATALDETSLLEDMAELYRDVGRRLDEGLRPADALPEAARLEREIDELGRFEPAYLEGGRYVEAARLAALSGDAAYLERRATRRGLARLLDDEKGLVEEEAREALAAVVEVLRRGDLTEENLAAVAERLARVLTIYDKPGDRGL